MGDLIQSIGVLIAGVVIWLKPSWQIVDPVCTFLFAALVVWTTFGILKQSISVILQQVPTHIDVGAIKEGILAIPAVKDVHDLHVWCITTGMAICTAHLMVDAATVEEQYVALPTLYLPKSPPFSLSPHKS